MYIRGKLAQRGSQPAAKFMRDGFDVWAESETPARAGQMEKEPAQTQMPNYGGAMNLTAARQKSLGMDVRGGAIEVPQVIKDAVQQAKNLIQMWRDISAWIDSFISDLQDEIIDNPKSKPNLVAFAKQLMTMINNVKVYKDTLDTVAAALGAVGLGRRGGRQLRGGMSFEDIGKVAGQIAKIYMWFKNNKSNIEQVLKLKSLQPYGQRVLDAVLPIFAAVGMGRGGFFGDFGMNFQPQFQDFGKMYQPAIEYGKIPVEAAGELAVPDYVKEKRAYLAKQKAQDGMEGSFQMAGGAKYSSCPPGWTDDGLTCRKDGQVQAKVKIGGKACRNRGLFGECWDLPTMKGGKACRNRGAFGECWDGPVNRVAGRVIPRKPILDSRGFPTELEPCPSGYIEDGLTCREVVGGGFYSGMMNNAMKAVAKPAMTAVAKPAVKYAYKYATKGGAKYEDCPPGYNAKGDLCFNPIRTFKDASGNYQTEGGQVVGRRKVGGKKPSARGEIVRKVMDQMGLSMIEASRYVKQKGLY